ncbi:MULTISPECIES: pyridoxamine 5'-phosphate oxidase family protein [Amycolatopsis]|uniref:Pyridoxamine 5'-phosphate oxidase family protein n=1 Tax=Amycolatopsis dendrobii TaxID=2760662 RepID=A0A7W3VRP3_9PSEU|nr:MULTISPECIES: pyridoxamine 5'-phosphate oxidase family protein [Amycolatopsis]MBB1151943.1 pyridoxamine 5'-phosphate oxidase family protein [Amycolatopsis dendrobii]UKD57852.1 pyridoxamine 5'-phosphate oxidase family protein [Amycolatopsis sp. FU40]
MSHAIRPAFHSGELAVQREAGVERQAARLSRMAEPAGISPGTAGFLAERTFLVVTGRDAGGRLWTSPITGPPGFLETRSETTLAIHRTLPEGDPLHRLPAGQMLGMTSVEFATRRRVRINGTLATTAKDHLIVEVEQAYGNCPQYIQQRDLTQDVEPAAPAGERAELSPGDTELIQAADTFFLGTINPAHGADASHRGGAPGFVRVEENALRWPDYPGNNLFNSLGNIAANPEAALLFFDFATGRVLQVSGTAAIEWGEAGRSGDDGYTGRIVRLEVHRVVEGRPVARQVAHAPYPRNPRLVK